MRMKKSEVQDMYQEKIPARLHKWEYVIPYLRKDITESAWLGYDDQTRRKLLEHYWDELELG